MQALLNPEIHETRDSEVTSWISDFMSEKNFLTSNSTVFIGRKPLSHKAKLIINKLNEFSLLEENWDSYGASAPSYYLIQHVKSFVKKADKFTIPFFYTAPGPDGEILLEFKNSSKRIEIIFNSQTDINVLFFDQENLSFEKSFESIKIEDLKEFLEGR